MLRSPLCLHCFTTQSTSLCPAQGTGNSSSPENRHWLVGWILPPSLTHPLGLPALSQQQQLLSHQSHVKADSWAGLSQAPAEVHHSLLTWAAQIVFRSPWLGTCFMPFPSPPLTLTPLPRGPHTCTQAHETFWWLLPSRDHKETSKPDRKLNSWH